MAIVGYTRVSTLDQNLHSQIDALSSAGAVKTFSDKLTGKNANRPGLTACLEFLRDDAGDVLLVYSTDRLGRSMSDVVSIVGQLQRRGIQFRSLTEPFNTTTAGGELFFHICAAFAQMNGRIISERTQAGLAAARARGRHGGRPTVVTPERLAAALQMRVSTPPTPWATIGSTLGVGASTIRRAVENASSGAAGADGRS
ncbi:hypothetical protein ASF48_17790 [Rathayibacter sp. Leaf299]|uniref:recombinase family protein n=1 Tax=Rathayibacter sp. Leaf299 TaxID=1736328 RepID=UPI0006FB4CED|nr:recombinase family protein [Rathayibacter sp. Leaf299]KQQ18770.1 hypothetical protein ASF48_17790 [Rathayibacter sp. Leaf299]